MEQDKVAMGGSRRSRRFSRATRFLLRLPTHLYDWHAGWLLGNRFLRLTHLGRKSGRRYQTMLEVVDADPATRELVVVAGFGPYSDWFRNIQAAPAVEVAVDGEDFNQFTGSSTGAKQPQCSLTMRGGTG